MRTRYWSNSKVADFIRGTAKPKAATADGWDSWNASASKVHPIRYWIVEEGFDLLQKVIRSPIEFVYNIKYWICNRYITGTHALTSNLERGSWHEFDKRVLHCTFDELVNFVEIETASQHIAWADKEDRIKYKTPWYASGWFRTRTWRSPAAGLDHLYWASNLKMDSNLGLKPGQLGYGEPTSQAEAAIETLALYHWWKNVRPNRPDPHDASGWTDVCANIGSSKLTSNLFGDTGTPDQEAAKDAALLKLHDLEKAHEQEDEDMLIRLVKLSKRLWT